MQQIQRISGYVTDAAVASSQRRLRRFSGDHTIHPPFKLTAKVRSVKHRLQRVVARSCRGSLARVATSERYLGASRIRIILKWGIIGSRPNSRCQTGSRPGSEAQDAQ